MPGTLEDMRIKIRRITRSPNASDLTDDEIDNAINTGYIYDMPEELRLFALKKTLTFFCEPYKDVYATDSVPGLDDFLNKYITVERPVYIAGNLAYFSQSREEFFNLYPMTEYRQQIATGDGVTDSYVNTLLNHPVVQGQNSFSSIAGNAESSGLVIYDQPVAGNNQLGNLVDANGNFAGNINYITGAYAFTFLLNGVATPPGNGEVIQAQSLYYKPSLPTAVLFYGNEFTLRPVPDRPYRVQFDAYIRPTAFPDDPTVEPFLQEWWQYLVYLGAKIIFQDRSDLESVDLIMPELTRQQDLILRRTLVQNSSKRPVTIYNQTGYPGWWYGNNNNGNF